MKFSSLFLIALLFFSSAFAQQKVDLIIVGGGASGTAAGIAAGRMGTKTVLLEPTTWLGGMLTSAGVSAIDGNHRLPSGIWGEFRKELESFYGGSDKLATGWVSNTLFEPKVGNQLLQKMVATVPDLQVIYQAKWKSAVYENGIWQVLAIQNGKEIHLSAPLLIDATELGDVAAAQGLPYRLGMDARDEIGEEYAPIESNDIVQDLTYVATLQDFGKGADKTIPKPADYDPSEFACACAHADPTTDDAPTLDCGKMLDYGKLPNGKYMINWPNCGNDHYVNLVELSAELREAELEKAKQTTLRFVYFIQHELGFKQLGLAEGEYPTADQLPMIPYHRESRRYRGLVDFTLPYVQNPYAAPNPLYRTGVAVGDYTIDHHHKKNPLAPGIDFIKIRVPSYNLPLGVLIPQNHPALILAEKSISVSNIVNGATRLQPVVLGIGQAAGVLASVAIRKNKAIDEVSIREVQQHLLDQGVYLMPFIDTRPSDPHFQAMQKAGSVGIFKGVGVPYLWANQTWFYPDRLATEFEVVDGLRPFFQELEGYWGASGADLTADGLVKMLNIIDSDIDFEKVQQAWSSCKLEGNLTQDRKLTRKEASVVILDLVPVFEMDINWNGFPWD
jgi:hypothetical protein